MTISEEKNPVQLVDIHANDVGGRGRGRSMNLEHYLSSPSYS